MLGTLVTGGNGFLGKHVMSVLRDRIDNYKYSLSTTRSENTDLRDLESAKDAIQHFDSVIHLAAVCGGIGANVEAPAKFWRDNLLMGINVLEACVQRPESMPRLIIAGTTCSYPERPRKIPFDETCLWEGYPERTNAPYGIAKRAIIEGANAYRRSFDLDVRILMPTNLYGPGDDLDLTKNHVIPAMIVKFLKAKMKDQKVVELWGDGTPTRDFLYVEDAAEAFADALESESKWTVLNLGTGVEVSIRELAETIIELTGYDGDIAWNGQLGGQPRRALDCKLAKKKLGWEAKTDLRTGLTKTVEWVKSQL